MIVIETVNGVPPARLVRPDGTPYPRPWKPTALRNGGVSHALPARFTVASSQDEHRSGETTTSGDRSDATADTVQRERGGSRKARSWPLLLLAAPAFVATWSGWVGLGELAGFGVMHPLPGIWDDASINTAITLPIGVETYAAYALGAWLSGKRWSAATRRFARWSALASLALGMAGQVAYHLLTVRGYTHAPWWITTLVSCLPVLVLGMGAALGHLRRQDAQERTDTAVSPMGGDRSGTAGGQRGHGGVDGSESGLSGAGAATVQRVEPAAFGPTENRPALVPGTVPAQATTVSIHRPGRNGKGPDGVRVAERGQEEHPFPALGENGARRGQQTQRHRHISGDKLARARRVAEELMSEGRELSRAALRDSGVRGKNAELDAVIRHLAGERSGARAAEEI